MSLTLTDDINCEILRRFSLMKTWSFFVLAFVGLQEFFYTLKPYLCNTVEPPVSDHTMSTQVVAYRRLSLYRVKMLSC